MSEREPVLEVGGLYRDDGHGDVAPVLFALMKLDHIESGDGDDMEIHEIAHIQIRPAEGDGVVMGHAPVAMKALEASAWTRVGDADVNTPFEEGYDAWREAFDRGEAGAFSIAPAAIYETVTRMMRHQTSSQGGDA